MAELAIDKLRKNAVKPNFVLTLDILFVGEIGQVPAEFISAIDIIMHCIRDNNIFLGGLLIFGSMDHTQIQPINAHLFLTSTHVITCFKMVSMSTSVRSSGDPFNKRIQQICQHNHSILSQNPQLIEEFLTLVSENCAFVENWNDEAITPSTYRLYGKRVPAKEAAR
eukprot:6796714-Ditylum_brightwellii.AAC.1